MNSQGQDDGETTPPFVLFQTPTREPRSHDVPSLPKPSSRNFMIRMVAVITLLATLVLLIFPVLQQVASERHTSSLPHVNVATISDQLAVNEETFPRLPLKGSIWSSSNATSVANKKLSEAAWQGLLNRFRLAVHDQSFEIMWLPLVIQGNKLFVAEQHLTRAKNERGKRFGAFIAMMIDALELRSRPSRGTSAKSKNADLPLLDEKWRDRPIPLLMALGDQRRCEHKPFPRFGWCTLEDDECQMLALPSYNVYRDAPDVSPDYDAFHNDLESRYPWSTKKAQVIWRGSATGRIKTDWTDLPRARLVNVSIQHPNLLDAAFVHSNQFKRMYPSQVAELEKHSRFAEWIDFQDFQRYRGVVDIDGNSWSARFGTLLCLNSVVLKVQPSNKNYFFRELQPWVHYIPVAANMSDMEDALRFAVSNRTARDVQGIVFRANEWCRTRLNKPNMAMDIFRTLNSYVQLLGNNATRWSQWEDLFDVYQNKMTLVEPSLIDTTLRAR